MPNSAPPVSQRAETFSAAAPAAAAPAREKRERKFSLSDDLVSMLELQGNNTSWSTDRTQPLQAARAGPSELEVLEGESAAKAAEAAAAAKADSCSTMCGAVKRALGYDESRQLHVDLARVRAERDAARKERDQLYRLCGDLKQQLLDERKVSPKARRPSLPQDLDLNREAIEAMFQGLEVIASDLYVHEVVARVVSIITRLLGCEHVTLFLADEEQRELSVLSAAGGLETLHVPYGRGLVGNCAEHREVMHIEDAYVDKRFDKDMDTQTGFRTRAVICCPLLDANGALIAVIQATNPLHGGSFSQRELKLLQFMQMPTAIALLNARLHKSLRSANESASSLVRVAMAVNDAGDKDGETDGETDGSLVKLMEKVVAEATGRFSADRCSMYVADHDKGEIWSLVAMGLPERFSVPIGKGISGKCAQSGDLINVRDAKNDPRTAHSISQSTGYAMKSTLCIPIIDRRLSGPERILGVIQLLNKSTKPEHFTVQDEASLQAFSNIVALAMRNAMVFDDLRQKDAEREMIFSSISSFICKFSVHGMLEWSNSPKLLEQALGVPEATMFEQRFDTWLSKIQTGGRESQAICLPVALDECLKTGAAARARAAELRFDDKNGADGSEPSRFFNFSLSPLVRTDKRGEERRVGAVVVLEDVSDQFKRKQAEAKLSELQAKIKREQSAIKKAVSETPLQRAIDVVGDLRDNNPELREPLQEILTQLTSSNVMLPSLMTDQSKMASMDDFTREFLGGQTGVELHLEPNFANKRRLSDSGLGVPSWKEQQASLNAAKRAEQAEQNSSGSFTNPRAGRRHSMPTAFGGPGGKTLVPLAALGAPALGSNPAGPPVDAPAPEKASVFVRRTSAPEPHMVPLDGASSDSGTPGKQRRSSNEEEASHVEELLKKMKPADWKPPSHISDTELFSWDLDLYDPSRPGRAPHGGASPNELLAMCHSLFESVNIRDVLGVSTETVQSFILAVNEGYLPMPFHNFSHATYVLHGSVICLKKCKLLHSLLEPIDKVALAIAALGHDIGHMGVQNSFLVNSNDPLALQYNDRSVLENMHTSRLFSVLRQRGSQLLDGLSTEQYKAVRKAMIGMIMATDLAQHFEDMAKFKNRMTNIEEKPFSSENLPDRQMAMEMVLHAADLSGPARPWKVSHAWASRVQEEFVDQVDSEKRLGIPVSAFLTANKAKLETGFIDLFAMPVWDNLNKLLPEITDRVDDMSQNYARWAAELKEEADSKQ